MKKALPILFATLLGTATAQQTVKATFGPATVDGVTTQNGMVTINGKTYVLTTALASQGAALLKTNSIGLYRYPNAQKTPLVLKGCINEWLFNGVNRVRVDSVRWNSQNNWHEINTSIQTSVSNVESNRHFDMKNIIVAYQDGRVIQQSKTPLQRVDYSGTYMETGRINPRQFLVRNPDDTGTETLTRFVLPAGFSDLPGVMTFDLTCSK
ncbi:hypothetical protein ACINK0_07060 [Deinococcus sp. VB343]|uniref:Uncharacterized protein n=1 Tax=Deinococcus sp. VB142 TaxID=3112952 RepID=A0AAU6Q6D1_9DEIO